MQNTEQPDAGKSLVNDAEWMWIHCDTFIPHRDRMLQTQSAFVIDRDMCMMTMPAGDQSQAAPYAVVVGNRQQA